MHSISNVHYPMCTQHDELPVGEEHVGRLAHLYGPQEGFDGGGEVRPVRRRLRSVERG